MIAEISSLISSTKAAYDIVKGISSLKAEIERNESIAKILEVLISVQSQALSVQAKTQELEIEKYELAKKLMAFETWSETESQYSLEEIASGVFVYSYKKTNEANEPMHWLCTNCWKDKIKSILQCDTPHRTRDISYSCPKCKNVIHK